MKDDGVGLGRGERVTILVGHGSPARGTSPEWLARMKALESARRRSGTPMSDEERRLDAAIRAVPRTDENDRYKVGLERLATKLAALLAPEPLAVAYNEFCAPSLEDAVASAVERGFRRVRVIPTMLVEGGSHSAEEIPEALAELREAYHGVEIVYCWPFDGERVAALFAAQLASFDDK